MSEYVMPDVFTSADQVEDYVNRALSGEITLPAPPAASEPPAPAPAPPKTADEYDPFAGVDPTPEQAKLLSHVERKQLNGIRPGWQDRLIDAQLQRANWAEAQAEGAAERRRIAAEQAADAARAERDDKMRNDPKLLAVEMAVAAGADAVRRWTALSDHKRVEAAAEAGLLSRQRGILGHELADSIVQRTGVTPEIAEHLGQLEARLVPCPDPVAWGMSVVQAPGKSGEMEPHVLTPEGGFTAHQKASLGLD
jgi:hypothetical protein